MTGLLACGEMTCLETIINIAISAVAPKLWGIFWRNSGCKRWSGNLSFYQKCHLLSRTVLAGFSWLFARWPVQKSVATEIDSMQSHMLSIMAKVPRLPTESLDAWFKKRNKVGHELAVRCGLWSSMWVTSMRKTSLTQHGHL